MRLVYSVLLVFLLPFALLRLFIRGFRDRRYWKHWPERFGFLKSAGTGPVIWLHAVSVGEVRAASPLILAAMARYPGYRWHITTTTPTGAETVTSLFGEKVTHSYFPYDLTCFVDRFLKRISPILVLIVETEIWPNLFSLSHRRDIPLCIINARLSETSLNRYRKLARFTAQTLRYARLVATRSEADHQTFLDLGARPESVVTAGDLKFDVVVNDSLLEKARRVREQWGKKRHVWVAGSTHPGEEDMILKAHQQITRQYPDCLLILVPRHPDRAGHAVELCEKKGFDCALTSQPVEWGSVRVIISDRIGELQYFYAAGDVAFAGGSLVPHGGQNPLEPAMVGVPVLAGPYTGNFTDAYRKLGASGALVTVHDGDELAGRVAEWFDNPAQRKSAGNAGRQVVVENRGAAERTLGYLVPLINE